MNSTRNSGQKDIIRVIALIFVFWAVMTMAISIPYVSLGPEEKAPDVNTGGISNAGVSQTSSSDLLRTLWIIFIVLLATMFVAYTIIAAMKKDREHFKGLFYTLIATVLLVGILLGITYLQGSPVAESISSRFVQDAGAGSAGDGSDVVEHSGTTAFFAILMMSLVLVGAVAYGLISTFLGKEAEKVPNQTEELMEKIEAAMRDLEDGKRVHDVIILAYDEMCRVLAKSGVKGEESMTPREFQDAVVEQTGIRPEPVEKLTSLFEMARYSTHPIDDSQRKEAIEALRDLKKEMERHELEERGGRKA